MLHCKLTFTLTHYTKTLEREMESSDKAAESAVVGNYVEMEAEGKPSTMKSRISKLFWHGGSAYDAWFSCASNQVTNFLRCYEKKIKFFYCKKCWIRASQVMGCENCRWLKCCWRCRIRSRSWGWRQGYCSSCFMGCLGAGLLISLAFSMLSIGLERRGRRWFLGTMLFR